LSITKKQSHQIQSIAILMMLFLHLFNRDYKGLFQPLIFLGKQPISYYFSLFSDACVPIFAFISGYGLYYKYNENSQTYKGDNRKKIKELYVKYWLILVIFAVVLGLAIGKEGYPGSWLKLILNITALNPSYNGAWWFFTTYILFVISSPFWFQLLEKINPYVYLGGLVLIYLISFYLRIYRTNLFNNEFLNWLQTQSALYFCTLLQFMMGAFFYHYKWGRISNRIASNPKRALFYFAICNLLLIILHAYIPNFIIAPFNGLVFIFSFISIHINKQIAIILDFLKPHTTNIWLVHMFFYMVFFKDFIYQAHFVVPVFLLLILCCLASSFIINSINRRISKIISK
jgi:hypothetical protein